MEMKHVRHGFGAVRPYLYGHLDIIEFVKYVFDAEELERYEFGERSFQVMVKIGDSIVILEAGELPEGIIPTRASIYVYVEDVDGAYKRALKYGATSLAEPEDKPYEERAAGVKDSFGNTWWIATYTKSAM